MIHNLKKYITSIILFPLGFSLTSCTSNNLPIDGAYSKNTDHRIKLLVLHNTQTNYQNSLQKLVNNGNISSHYLLPQTYDKTYLDDELSVIKLVNEGQNAWHAGNSYWRGVTRIDAQSIGVDMVNMAKCSYLSQDPNLNNEEHLQKMGAKKLASKQMCFYPDYDPKQIALLIKLARKILKHNPGILPTNVIGHSDIAPKLTNEPGPRFPWYQLYQAGIGAWYAEETVFKYGQLFDSQLPTIGLVQQALHGYGYNINETGELDQQTQAVLNSFQAHFLPWQLTNRADEQTVATLFALLERVTSKSYSSIRVG